MRLPRRTFNRLLALSPFALAGCDSGENRKEKPKPVLAAMKATTRPTAVRYLALGDSYTVGEGVAPNETWPVRLVARLREGGADIADPEVIARTGWRGDDLHFALDRASLKGPYGMVSLLIGVNNQYQGKVLEDFRSQFIGLLRRSQALAGGDSGRVLVLSIPDYGVMPAVQASDRARVAKEIDAFNDLVDRESKTVGARYVDVTPVSRQAAEQPDLVAGDGLHPSAKMYERWVDLALPVAREILASPSGGPSVAPVAPAAPGKPGG
jgi:lysophospholipase L1-like esterase